MRGCGRVLDCECVPPRPRYVRVGVYLDEERRVQEVGDGRLRRHLLQVLVLAVPVHRAAPVHHLQQLLQHVTGHDVRSGLTPGRGRRIGARAGTGNTN